MKPVKRIPALMYFLIANFLFNAVVSEKLRIGSNFSLAAMNSAKMKTLKKEEPEKKEEKTIKSEIYFQGWIKYFRWLDLPNSGKPNKFYKNDAYAEQQKYSKGSPSTESDQWGSLRIPDDKHFFAVVYKDSMNIMTSRDNPIAKVVDTLSVDLMRKIPDDDNFSGGVKNIGSFPEGYCFEVRTLRPPKFFKMSPEKAEPLKGVREIWMICSDTEKDYKQFMNTLINLKLKKQHEVGIYVYAEPEAEDGVKESDDSVNGMAKNEQSFNRPNLGKDDGYWVLLQDWGDCTLNCGGGLEYQQLMCVPPKAGGRPCEGPAVRTRPCNTQPCPQADAVQTNSLVKAPQNPDEKQEAPVFKMMAISKRPQRYDKCHIKESDAMMSKATDVATDLNLQPKIPVRLVMNEKTIAVFIDESLTNHVASFVLRTTTFMRVADNPRCFILMGKSERAMICQLGNEGAFVEEWDYDFNLFKMQCKKKRSTYDAEYPEMNKLKEEFDNRVQNLEAEMVQERAEEVRESNKENESIQLKAKVQKAASTTLTAIDKEIKLEDMIEKEELEREREEQEELNTQLETEKKKNDCLMKSIKEKEKEDQYNVNKARAEAAIQEVQKNANNEIGDMRVNLKKKLAELRKKAARKKQQIQNEIMTIRLEAAQRMQQMAKAGDATKCFNPPASVDKENYQVDDKQLVYCQENFPDNPTKFEDCKNIPESFCYLCCETEFGELHVMERDKCNYEQCDKKPQ